jgi:hypothetical protein
MVSDKKIFMTKMAAKLKIEKRGWNKKKSSPLKLLSQSQPNFTEMILGWSYVKLSLAVGAILVEGPNRRIIFWKRTIQWLFHQKNHRANWNQTFEEWSLDGLLPKLCPVIPTSNQDGRQAKNRKKIGSYVKLSSAVGAILVEEPNRRTHFWKRTIQWLFHQNFVLIEQMVSDKKTFVDFDRLWKLEKWGDEI